MHPPDSSDAIRSVPERLRILDTTLRDGEQAPGFSMDRRAKLRLAQAIEALGVDIIEAGFPQASPDDFAAVAQVAGQLHSATACALARCQNADIDSAGRALEKAQRSRIHIFLSTSPLHREHKLGKSKAQVIDIAIAGIERAKALCHEVEFTAEDALRTEPDYLVEIFDAAVAAGATVLNAPDTVGYTTPEEIARLFAYLRMHVKGAEGLTFSAHCHDDLGLAVANTLAAIGAGARQVECTINGIGERAGNAALEEVVMALKVRAPLYGIDTGIDTRRLHATSRLLTELTGQAVQRNKAIVGDNAFAHESGIHQHGMLKHRGTYEIMRPEDVGISATKLVLGKHSGKAAVRARLVALGQQPDEAAMEAIMQRFKALADKKREVHDEDLEAIALGIDPDVSGPWHIAQLSTASHLGGSASASVKLRHDDGREATETTEAAIGDGPVDAVLLAIGRATGTELTVRDFSVRAIGAGGDAQGQAHLIVEHRERTWNGHGYSTDIVEATALAALAIINRIERHGAPAPAPVVAHL